MEEKRESPPGQQLLYIPPSMLSDRDELDLVAVWRIIWRRKWFIGLFSLFWTLVAVWVTLYYLPEEFKSEAVIQPVVETTSTAGLAAKFAPLISGLGLPSLGSDQEKSRLMVNFLSSRTLKENIIKDFNLLPRIFFRNWDPEKKGWDIDDPEDIPTAVKAIQDEDIDNYYSVAQDETSGLISISYLDQDPGFAAKVVQGVIERLDRYLKFDYITDAKRNRIFVEGELKRAVRELEYWERQVPNARHPETEVMREREAALAVYAELRKQYELAKIEEARELIAFKILDSPLVPEVKDRPFRSLICLIVMFVSGTFALLAVFFVEFISLARKEEDSLGAGEPPK